MPPTSSPRSNASPAPPHDLGGVIEQERLPAGREDLPEPLIAHSQRERLLISMAGSCAKKGYGATTIADICEAAGVSRATFYELFKDKEDCFHAAMELALAEAMGRIVAVYSPDKPWATMVRDAAAAFLDLLASRPASPAWRWSRRRPRASAPSSSTPRASASCSRCSNAAATIRSRNRRSLPAPAAPPSPPPSR